MTTIVAPTKRKVPKDPSQRDIPNLFPSRINLRKSLANTYYPVEHHIYYNGFSFRVRVQVKGKTESLSTHDKEKAIKFRNRKLKQAKRKK